MAHRRHTGPALLALAGLLLPGTTWARQNIAIGEITIGYDYQERKYDNEELDAGIAYRCHGRPDWYQPRGRPGGGNIRYRKSIFRGCQFIQW